MAEGYVPDPNSPEALSAIQRSIEQRINQLKLGQPATTVLGYATASVNQNGLAAATTDLTGLTKTVVVGARRLIRITAFAVFQKHTTKAAIQFFIREGGSTLNQAVLSVDGTTDDYATLLCIAVVSSPTEGSHTYKLSTFIGSGTADLVCGVAQQAYMLVEDAGLAPA